MSGFSERLAAVAAALGLWLIVAAALLPGVVALGEAFAFWSYVLTGAGIAAFSGYSWFATDRDLPGRSLAALASGLLGVWLIALPFYTVAVEAGWLPWNDVIVGGVVIWIGLRNAWGALDVDLDLAPSRPNEGG